MDFKTLIKKAEFNWEKIEAIPDGGSELRHEFEIEPEDFLDYAELDIQSNDSRSKVNALSNAKRAIDCCAKKIIEIFKLKPRTNSFPSTLELLQEIGVVAPRIVSKVNKNRNFLEHEYKLPTKEAVEDAIDIANLFVSATNGTLRGFWTEFFIKEEGPGTGDSELNNSIYFSFDEKNREWTAVLHKGEDPEAVVSCRDDYYKTITKLAMAVNRNSYKIDEALKEFALIGK